jgi:Coenzyme PQQ synthesis protein D (PqqD)
MRQLYRRNPKVEQAPLNEEAILFDPEASRFLVLNQTSALLWDQLTEARTPEHLAEHVVSSFGGVDFPSALKDVEALLEQMLSHELVLKEERSLDEDDTRR